MKGSATPFEKYSLRVLTVAWLAVMGYMAASVMNEGRDPVWIIGGFAGGVIVIAAYAFAVSFVGTRLDDHLARVAGWMDRLRRMLEGESVSSRRTEHFTGNKSQ